jgi:putative transposase
VIAATVFEALLDALQFVRTALHSHRQLAAENLFLRKQLALYIERQTKPRRATDGTRLTLVMLARFIDWRPVLTIVQSDTLVRWHRQTFRLLWRWKSRPVGRPPIPAALQQLIAEMARANQTWGEERHRRRTLAQTRCLALAANRQTLHASSAFDLFRIADPDVEYVRAQPCARRARV